LHSACFARLKHATTDGQEMNILKYACIGGVCTVIDFTIFIVFTKFFNVHYLLVSTVSFSLAVFLNYYLCINLLFKSGVRFTKKVELLSFFLINIIGLLIHQAILFCSVDLLSIALITSKAIATATVFTWNYLGRKYFVFNPPRIDINKA
jgi:putative flippase GtrA